MPWHEEQSNGHKIEPPYTMMAVLLKMDHPCFFHFFDLSHADGGFPLRGGFFFLWGFVDIAFGPHDDFDLFPQYGIYRYNRIAP